MWRIRNRICICFIILLVSTVCITHGLEGFLNNRSIYTQDPTKAIETTNVQDPLREGSLKFIDSDPTLDDHPDKVRNVINIGFITQYGQVKSSTLNLIKNIVNYALGLLSLIAVLYLLYHGFLMVTSGEDEGQYKKGLGGIKYAAIALVGMGVSWFIITFIIYLVDLVTGTT